MTSDKVVCTCDMCMCDIYDGDEYYEVDDITICSKCIEGCEHIADITTRRNDV